MWETDEVTQEMTSSRSSYTLVNSHVWCWNNAAACAHSEVNSNGCSWSESLGSVCWTQHPHPPCSRKMPGLSKQREALEGQGSQQMSSHKTSYFTGTQRWREAAQSSLHADFTPLFTKPTHVFHYSEQEPVTFMCTETHPSYHQMTLLNKPRHVWSQTAKHGWKPDHLMTAVVLKCTKIHLLVSFCSSSGIIFHFGLVWLLQFHCMFSYLQYDSFELY